VSEHHEKMLEEAKEWLENVDADEFLEKILEFQKNAGGPTVDEFINSFNLGVNVENE
jgi:preprotein translocase subunit Sss1